jgi:DNA (cytosine-5)-methyltransferase 1
MSKAAFLAAVGAATALGGAPAAPFVPAAGLQGLFIDSFAGGGGASTGIAAAIGRDPDIAINHDAEAIAMHTANHPGTHHLCQDIWQAIPIQVTGAQPVAGAWFSPDCKEYSKAKGGPVKDRNIRELAWTVVYWIQQTQPTVVYLENVEEFRDWGPLDPETLRIIPEKKGETFRQWCRQIRRAGYKLQARELRACDYGAPTSRKRLYVIARRDGEPIVWPKPTHGHPESRGVRRGLLLPYRTAAECIDWTIPCRSIFDRPRDLKDNTLRRIAHGVMRYVVNAARPFIIPVTHSQNGSRVHDSLDPLRTVTTANGGEFAAVDATLAPHITKFHSGSVGAPMDGQMPVVTANGQPARPAGANPLGIAGATLVGVGGRRGQSPPLPVDGTYPTTTTKADTAVVAATMVQSGWGERKGQTPRTLDLEKPAGTAMAGGVKQAVVTAHLEKFNADMRPKSAEVPLDVVLAGSARHAVVETEIVEAPFVDRQFGNSNPSPATEPLGATTAGGGGKSAQVSAFLSSFYTSNTNGGRGTPKKPLKTVMAGANHHSLVCAHMEQANTGMVGHDTRKPLSTIVGKGCTQRIVETTILEAEDLPPEMMAKATRCAAFLVKYFGTAIGADVQEPFHTVTTLPRFAVVTVTIDAVTYVIVDIGMRMLQPRELARAQGFPEDYILDPIAPQMIRGKIVYKPLTKAAQIRMIGNSVCPDVAKALVAANQPRPVELAMAA